MTEEVGARGRLAAGPLCCVNTPRTKEAAGGGFRRFLKLLFSSAPRVAQGQILGLHCPRGREFCSLSALHGRQQWGHSVMPTVMYAILLMHRWAAILIYFMNKYPQFVNETQPPKKQQVHSAPLLVAPPFLNVQRQNTVETVAQRCHNSSPSPMRCFFHLLGFSPFLNV